MVAVFTLEPNFIAVMTMWENKQVIEGETNTNVK